MLEDEIALAEKIRSEPDDGSAARLMMGAVSELTSCDSLGIKIRTSAEEFRMLASEGLDERFLKAGSFPCGLKIVEGGGRCACKTVLASCPVSGAGNLTAGGSFFANRLSAVRDKEGCAGKFDLSACLSKEFESIALVPLRHGAQIVGLIFAASRDAGKFSPESLDRLETFGRAAGLRFGATGESAGPGHELSREDEVALALAEMASSVSHKLKNPLAGMMLAATRLKRNLTAAGMEKEASIAESICSGIEDFSGKIDHIFMDLEPPVLPRSLVGLVEAINRGAAIYSLRKPGSDPPAVLAETCEEVFVRGAAELLAMAFAYLLSSLAGSGATGGSTIEISCRHAGQGIRIGLKLRGASGNAGAIGRLSEFLKGISFDREGVKIMVASRIVKSAGGTLDMCAGAGNVELTLNFECCSREDGSGCDGE